MEKHDGGWWKGDFEEKKGGWFPTIYVEETAVVEVNDEKQLGNLQQGAIDVTGCRVEIHNMPGNNLYCLRIFPKNFGMDAIGVPAIEVASEGLEEAIEWQRAIEDVRNKAETKEIDARRAEQVMRQNEARKKIAREMSDLVIYCRPIPFLIESEPS